jgi:hypothetical protein
VATELIERIGGLPAEDLKDQPEYLKELLWGKVGSGKTWQIGSASEVPEMCPILYLNIEGGWRTIKRNFPQAVEQGLFHVVTPIDKYDGGRRTQYKWQQLEEVLEDLKQQSSRGVLRYNTIGVDSHSEAYDLGMEWWLAVQYAADNKRDIDLPGAAGGQDDFGRDWNKARSVIRRMTRGFRDLPCHVIFTAHEEEKKAKDSNMWYVMPSFPGKVQTDLPGFVDECLYVYTVDSGRKEEGTGRPIMERALQCQPTVVRPICKSRSNLPMVVRNPRMSTLLALTGIAKEAE